MRQFLSTLALAIAMTMTMPASVLAQGDIIEARKANFKQSGIAMRKMRGQLQNGDFDAISASAEKIAAWAAQMPDFFPVGSGPDQNKTDAKSVIWERFDAFTALAHDNKKAALALAKTAKSGDTSAIMAQMQAVGRSCGACHSQFKN